ncbi:MULTISPECIES: hypothetical protein [Halorussus]|uniref:hypothetical protein n=1 Tax=Halorussus TaxID=1070314 RepID=UPI000E21370A|nr:MULTISPECIES: hypothetical protein [Halorussus]NHN58666.1 hypothetical protein [Halorussus sp. JP-T4]
MGDAEEAEMPRQVYSELATLRQMGTDLSDPQEVVARLDACNFRAALDWLLDSPEAYERIVLDETHDAGSP